MPDANVSLADMIKIIGEYMPKCIHHPEVKETEWIVDETYFPLLKRKT